LDKRIQIFDIAKGVAILFVIVGHLNFPMWLINYIYFFHMPFFVLISGMLYKERNIDLLLINSIKIFKSYWIYGVFFMLFSFLLKPVNISSFIDFILVKPTSIFSINFFGIFWFLIALLIIKLITYLLKPNYINLFISLIISLIILYVNKYYFALNDFPFAFFQGIVLLPFYYFGYLLKRFEWFKIELYLLSTLVFLIGVFFMIEHNGGYQFKIVNYHMLQLKFPLITIIFSIFGSILFLNISKNIENTPKFIKNFFQFLGKNSFVFYALHLFSFYIIKLFLKNIGIKTSSFFLLLLTLFLISIFILIINKLKINPKIKNIILFQ
jgi:acyltransferase